MLCMSCTGYIIPRPCWTRSALLHLTRVINVKTLWETWQTLSVFSDLPPHENLNESMEKKENKEKKNRGKQNKKKTPTEGCGISSCGKELSFCISVFLCSQPIRSVAKLTACVWHILSLHAPTLLTAPSYFTMNEHLGRGNFVLLSSGHKGSSLQRVGNGDLKLWQPYQWQKCDCYFQS